MLVPVEPQRDPLSPPARDAFRSGDFGRSRMTSTPCSSRNAHQSLEYLASRSMRKSAPRTRRRARAPRAASARRHRLAHALDDVGRHEVHELGALGLDQLDVTLYHLVWV